MRLWAIAVLLVLSSGMTVDVATADHRFCWFAPMFDGGQSPTGYQTSGTLRVEFRVYDQETDPETDCGLDATMTINGEERAVTIDNLGSGHYKVWHDAEFSGGSYVVSVSFWDEHGQGGRAVWDFVVLPPSADTEGVEIVPGAGAGARVPDELGFNYFCVLFVACAGPFWTPSPATANASASFAPVVVHYGYSEDSIGPFIVSEDPIPLYLCEPGCPFPVVGRTETEVHVDVAIMGTSIPVHHPISI